MFGRTGSRLLSFTTVALVAAAACLIGSTTTPSRSVAQDSETGILQVDVVGFRGRAGRLLVAVYDNSNAWLEIRRAHRVRRHPIRGRNVLTTFNDIRRGREYAVSALHDENRDDRLNMEWLPLPHPGEGAGASRNPRPGMGPPSWDSAKFRFTGDRRIVITLTY